MSALKYQLITVLSSISLEGKSFSDPESKARYYLIKRISESPKSIARLCRSEGVSTAWFYKWSSRVLKFKSWEAFKSQSRRPQKSPRKTRSRIEKKICRLRRTEPYHGAERIQFDLKRLYKEHCPVSTINRILSRNNLMSQKHFKKLTKKHIRRIQKPSPGFFQMDFKYVPYLVQGKQYYQLSIIDHLSSWRKISIYPEKSTDYVIQFLKEFKSEWNLPIYEIQTDNDTAFTDKFSSQMGRPTGQHRVDLWCLKHKIKHKLIPVGEKEINGKVENSHKQDDREFYSQIRAINECGLRLTIRSYNERWNILRRTKRLNWLSPEEKIWHYCAVMLSWCSLVFQRLNPNYQPIYQLTNEGDAVLTIKPTKGLKKKAKTKGKNFFDRYMQYIEWEEKQKVS